MTYDPHDDSAASRAQTRSLIGIASIALVIVVAVLFWRMRHPAAPLGAPATSQASMAGATIYETEHYRIVSTASPAQVRIVAERVEALHAAYFAFHALSPVSAAATKLQLVLYRDRAQFQAHNRSGKPWAEAYYRAPACHAYLDSSSPNPTHWMLHEATHQLAREVARYPKRAWSDEGLATYLSSSVVRGGQLVPGEIDPDTYPVWWVRDLALSGDRHGDFAQGRLIPLRALISGEGGPPIGEAVNQYYIGYWSLAHFLLHHDGGRHADAFRTLIATGGGLAEFERLVGPVEQIEAQWYEYLRARNASLRIVAPVDDAVIIDMD
ncbi:MAG: hypothetical protein ACREO3_01570 [Arenimonas sp.]